MNCTHYKNCMKSCDVIFACLCFHTLYKMCWCVITRCVIATVMWLIFMSRVRANTDRSTVWARACGCQSARASWCHRWSCPSTPSPAARQTCWLPRIRGRSGQCDSAQSSTLLSERETVHRGFFPVWSTEHYTPINTAHTFSERSRHVQEHQCLSPYIIPSWQLSSGVNCFHGAGISVGSDILREFQLHFYTTQQPHWNVTSLFLLPSFFLHQWNRLQLLYSCVLVAAGKCHLFYLTLKVTKNERGLGTLRGKEKSEAHDEKCISNIKYTVSDLPALLINIYIF